MPDTASQTESIGSFFSKSVVDTDRDVAHAIHDEIKRQQNQIELIASENIVSRAVLEAQGSPLTNKYAEGYPGRRYYGGCEHVDVVETLAINRAKQLFGSEYANVQPSSGSQANQGVFLALVKPGDRILGMSLDAGGHLTHGARPNMSGKWFEAHAYGVLKETAQIDYDALRKQAKDISPKLIVAGGSAYPREIDFAEFRKIADECGAYLMVDMAHFAGLVAGGVYPNPVPHAHVCTTTTHKTLRGPRGGMIISNDLDLGKKFNSAIFPGMQGGPLMHVIAGKAVAFGEALRPEFKTYASKVVSNSKVLAKAVSDGGYDIVSGGTDSHLSLVDLRPKGLKGNQAEEALERAYITCNKNGVPFDPEKPTITSGLRIGSPACTTRGFGEGEFKQVGEMMVRVLDALVESPEGNPDIEADVRKDVLKLTARFPIYPELA